ncbi:DUF805 domain-containing protein [Candidatus Parcubacteria bacterium]|nr:MAG: DUF805 domain-containing protein [Candidatus Parcubacteria bacterium]
MNYYLAVLKKYAVFNGRARRAEYWYFVLFNMIFAMVLGIIQNTLGLSTEDGGPLTDIYQLAVFIPSIAAAVRRMHDVNKSGWFVLIPLYNLFLAVTAGDKGENRFGPDPIEEEEKQTGTKTEPKSEEKVVEASVEPVNEEKGESAEESIEKEREELGK